jgi:hypothetical protein
VLKYYDSGASVYLILAAISTALMTATKETWIINGPVLLIALATTTAYFWVRGKLRGRASDSKAESAGFLERFGGPISVATVALMAFTVFIVVNVLFYSSFFTNYPKGVNDALLTLSLWRKRTHEHEHPWSQYLVWLIQEEGTADIFGWNRRAHSHLARRTTASPSSSRSSRSDSSPLTSLVGYKTPWITLNFIVPLALTSGYALEVFYQKLREFQQPWLFLAPAILFVAFCGYQMYQLNFVHYDDDKYVYVYAHTRRETLVMLEQIDHVANQMKTGYDTGVAIVSPEYWPLPWYFRITNAWATTGKL